MEQFFATERALLEDRFQRTFGFYHLQPSPQPGPSGLYRVPSPSVFIGSGVDADSNASTVEFTYQALLTSDEWNRLNQEQQPEELVVVNATPSDADIIDITGDDDDDDDTPQVATANEICGICLEPLVDGRFPTTMCGRNNHMFCVQCIVAWRHQPYGRGCPYCRNFLY